MTRQLVGVLWLVLAVVHAAVTPLAHATPPDPVWVDGFFDDDDNDNSILSITSSTATLDSFSRRNWSIFSVSRPAHVLEVRGLAPAQYCSAVDVRAPPRS
jgi:hypothetical protein